VIARETLTATLDGATKAQGRAHLSARRQTVSYGELME